MAEVRFKQGLQKGILSKQELRSVDFIDQSQDLVLSSILWVLRVLLHPFSILHVLDTFSIELIQFRFSFDTLITVLPFMLYI